MILCPARNIGAKITRAYTTPLAQGRLLILSPFDETRITAETWITRNRLVAALADAVFIAYAEPNDKLAQLCREVLAWRKPVFTFEDAANTHLLARGAQTWTVDERPKTKDEQ